MLQMSVGIAMRSCCRVDHAVMIILLREQWVDSVRFVQISCGSEN